MTFTLIKPIEKSQGSKFIPVHRNYNQPDSSYNSSQQEKRHDNKDKNNQMQPPIKGVKRDIKTGDLIVKYYDGTEKRYTSNDSNYNSIEENLRYQNYSTNFDYKA